MDIEKAQKLYVLQAVPIIKQVLEFFLSFAWFGFYSSTHKVVVSLNDFQEERRSVLHRFGEDLEEVALVIEIH